ncbi:chalcone isomerase family protein [Wenzhouxiangella sp. XN24]|uniref:chalcone isomerase family protein n=1 Tax=Wenzhouxiangella sp. XN24 TaxID=2713569 RepID=UPI0013EA0D0B|nr:chalcone isomerase family protein [Wenzhouxiangella sp. XN24]NGX15696.1 hypothetical protein [Wenzhouxiangella sp. XN24]
MALKTPFPMLLAVFGVLLAGSAPAAISEPAPAGGTPALEGLVEIGSGEMTWFGLEVYDARLLDPDGQYDGSGQQGALALEITYRRNIPRSRLLDTTEREWNRLERELNISGRSMVQDWLGQLEQIWPDVAPGDRIIAVYEPDGATRFYGNDGLLGVVEDPRFGPAFLGIWLHPDTRAGDLRTALIGEQQ